MGNPTRIAFVLGIAAALTLGAGSQLTGGGGLTRVVTNDARLTGSGTSTAPLGLSLSTTAPITGTGSAGSPFALSLSTTSPITGTGSAGSPVALANTAVTPGSYTYSSLTVDAQGRLTAASSGTTPVLPTRSVSTGTGLSGGGDLSADRTLSLANTAVTAGSYTNPSFTVNAQGQITTATSNTVTGRFLGTQVLTGSATGTLATGTSVVHLRLIGQGGGGGGCKDNAAGGACAAAGGSSGMLLDIWIGTPGSALPSSFTYAGGSAAGGGGAGSTGAAGTAGSDSTATINGVTYTAKGGGGGGGSSTTTGNGGAIGTAPAAGTSSGGVTTFGQGEFSVVIGGNAWNSGGGGWTALGAGGIAVAGTNTGNAGSGMGGGGGGATCQSGAGSKNGGAGAAGGLVLEQYGT